MPPVAQLLAAHQVDGALLAAGDAVEGEPGPACAFQNPSGHVLRSGGGMEGCGRLPGDRARFGFGRPVRPLPLL
jgi:hypothetical protein